MPKLLIPHIKSSGDLYSQGLVTGLIWGLTSNEDLGPQTTKSQYTILTNLHYEILLQSLR